MNKGDDILLRMMEMSKSVRQKNEADKISAFIQENVNKLRNTFFIDLSKCNTNEEKIRLVEHFIYESRRREQMARKASDQVWVEIYSKFQRDTLNPLKDFTITSEPPTDQSKLSDVKPSAPPVVQVNTPESKDDRITCNATPEIILEYFMILSTTLWNGKPIMTAQDVTEFCATNFAGFEKPGRLRKFPLNIKNKRVMIYFLYIFYSKLGQRRTKIKYAYLLKNFTQFANVKPENITTNFSKEPKLADIISTKEFFSKIKKS